MSFALPETMRHYIDARVASGHYGNTSEYIRDLIRKDQEEQAVQRLRGIFVHDGIRQHVFQRLHVVGLHRAG